MRHALQLSQYARTRIILQNDRRDEEVAADGGGVLLAPGAQCWPGKYEELLSQRREFHRFKRATERAGNRAFVCGCAVKRFRGKPSCIE